MRPEHLSRLDLNLLTVADALLETASVTETAAMVHLSQPAVSRALGRLRGQLKDPLLIREGRCMVLTPYAKQLRPRLRSALLDLERTIVQREGFEPSTAQGTMTLATSDFAALAFVPQALDQLREEAPRLCLVLVPYTEPFEALLESGDCDLTVGHQRSSQSWIHSEPLFQSGWSCVGRPNHPWFQTPTLKAYLNARHVMVSPSGQGGGPVDAVLGGMKKRRTIVARVPDFVGALVVAAQTNVLVTVPTRLATAAEALSQLTYKPVPWSMPQGEVVLSWHAARTKDPRLSWFRERVHSAVA